MTIDLCCFSAWIVSLCNYTYPSYVFEYKSIIILTFFYWYLAQLFNEGRTA